MSSSGSANHTVLVEIEPGDGNPSVVVSAAVQVAARAVSAEVLLCLSGVDDLLEQDAEELAAWCLAAVPRGAPLPEVRIVGHAQALREDAATHLRAGRDAATDAAEVLRLQDLLGRRAAAAEAAAVVTAALQPLRAQNSRLLAQRATALRDGEQRSRRGVGGNPLVVAVFQHISYWGAVERLYEELAGRADVDFEVVALDSPVDTRAGGTAEFLTARGFEPRHPMWFIDHLDLVDAVLLENPYDEMRPPPFHAAEIAARGIRLVGVPYGNNAISGEFMESLLWDLPLQRLAWRYYLPEPGQRGLYARHCAAGDEPVRVLGSLKLDRILAPRPSAAGEGLKGWASGRPLVLYNPHFRMGPGGWSTFDRYVEPLLEHFERRDDRVLLIRPHFRLFATLAQVGAGHLERRLRDAVERNENIALDETPDYADALWAADVMVSDLSSLANEYSATGRPLLYLHREDGPGPTAEDRCYRAARRATAWSQVEAFLDHLPDPGRAPGKTRGRDGGVPVLEDGRSSERVASDLVASLRAELGLPESAAAPMRLTATRRAGEPLPAPAATLVGAGAIPAMRDGGARTLTAPRLGPGRLEALPATGSSPAAAAESPLSSRQAAVVHVGARQRDLQDHVVFTSFRGKGVGCNPAAIARELARQDHPLERFWVVTDLAEPVPHGCSPLLMDSREHHERLARARFVVDNETTPLALERRPGQVILQTWHGTPLKKLRFDLHEVSPRSEKTLASMHRDAQLWDYMLSPNPHTSEVLRRGFRFTGEVIEVGYPRNDVLADVELRGQRAAVVRRVLGLSPSTRIVLYAPTWRDDAMVYERGERRQLRVPTLDWAALTRNLGSDHVLLVRGHRFVGDLADASGGSVRDVSDYPDMADLLAAADVLVTDYSSSFFDFAITGRPMVFFTYDLEKYRDQTRGLYFPMEEEVPGPVVQRAEEVTELLLDVGTWQSEFANRYEAFRRRFCQWDDGRASARVVEAVFR